jgi:hypothetical protein
VRRVSEGDIDWLLKNPDRVQVFLFGEPPPLAPSAGGIVGFLLRLSPIKIESVSDDEGYVYGAVTESGKEIDLDKAWHGLHFLFTGTAWEGEWPGCFLLRGGEELGDGGEIGQGPPIAYRPDKVREIAMFLSGLPQGDLEKRFDSGRMSTMGIYPDPIWRRPATGGVTPLQYLTENFRLLRQFVTDAEESGDGIVVVLA